MSLLKLKQDVAAAPTVRPPPLSTAFPSVSLPAVGAVLTFFFVWNALHSIPGPLPGWKWRSGID